MSRLRLLNYSREELAKMQESGKAYLDLVVKGKWKTTVFSDRYICSECKHDLVTQYKPYAFCPCCGADMREDEPDKPITREEVESGITVYVEGKYDPIYLGSSPHDGPMYKCPKCGQVFSSWEWLGKKEFTCKCGATWDVPK